MHYKITAAIEVECSVHAWLCSVKYGCKNGLYIYLPIYQGAVQTRSAGVQKCCWCQSVPHGLVHCHKRFRNRTPSVRVTTGLLSLCIQPMAAVRLPPSGSCTDPYSRCMKMPLVPEYSPWTGELA